MQKTAGLLIVVIGVLLVAGIFIGMEYQKTMTPPPTKEVNIELFSYSGPDIVNRQNFTLKIEKDWLGVSTDSYYVHLYNVTMYGLIIHYV